MWKKLNLSKVGRPRKLFGLLKFSFRQLQTAALLLAILVVGFLFWQSNYIPKNYQLDKKSQALVGAPRQDITDFLKEEVDAYAFKPTTQTNFVEKSVHAGRVNQAFSAKLHKDANRGIKVSDEVNKLEVTLAPEFATLAGQQTKQNSFIYPAKGAQLVYTLTHAGLKEDIIIQEPIDKASYQFRLSLPDTAEARLGKDGSIGIYGSQLSGLGEISAASEADKAALQKVQQKAEKNQLLITIPAPIVKEAGQTEHHDKAAFKLRPAKQSSEGKTDYQLTLAANDLENLAYPISLDPTMVVHSAANFEDTTPEWGLDYDSTNLAYRRQKVTGGALGAWQTTTAYPVEARLTCVFTHQNYIYGIAGWLEGGINVNNAYRAPINTDGSLGAWSNAFAAYPLSLPGQCWRSQVHNGQVYLRSNDTRTVWRASFRRDGRITAWIEQVNALPSGFENSSDMVMAKGFVYNIGGLVSGNQAGRSEVFVAPIQGDGSFGAFAATSALALSVHSTRAVAHNGWLYTTGGFNNADQSNVQRAPINEDGTLGSWINQAAAVPEGKLFQGVYVYGGYLYVIGGKTGGTASANNYYAAIHNDGSVGAFRQTASLPTGTYLFGYTQHNGRLYVVAGCLNATPVCAPPGENNVNTVLYSTIKADGEVAPTTWSSSTSLNTLVGINGRAAAVYNGYVYVAGGSLVSTGATINTVEFAKINQDGTLGAWSTSATYAMAAGRLFFSLVAHDGYLYAIGGCTSNCASSLASVEKTALSPANGTPGSWSAVTGGDLINGGRAGHKASVYNGKIYLVGGSTQTLSEVATINASTHNLTWVNGPALPAAQNLGGSDIWNGYWYIGGGLISSAPTNKVLVSQINNAGVAGAWSDAGALDMLAARDAVDLRVVNGHLYAWSNTTLNAQNFSTEFSRINANGTLAGWQQTQSHNDEGGGFAAHFATNGRLYSVNTSGTTQFQEVQNGGDGAPINITQTTDLRDPDLIINPLTGGRIFGAAVVAEKCIFIGGGTKTGGPSYGGAIDGAPLNANGSIGTWTAKTAAPAGDIGSMVYAAGNIYISNSQLTWFADFNASNCTLSNWQSSSTQNFTHGPGSLVYSNGYLYSLSGLGSSTKTEYAKIQPNGSIGAWQNGPDLQINRGENATVAVANGYLYVIAGCSFNGSSCVQAADANSKNAVEFSKIQTNGSIGSWQATTSLPGVGVNSAGFQAVVQNGYLYVFGGVNDSLNPNHIRSEIYYAPMGSDGRLGNWQVGSLPEGLYQHKLAFNSTHFYILSGNSTVAGTDSIKTFFGSTRTLSRVGQMSKRYDFDSPARLQTLVTRASHKDSVDINVNYRLSDESLAPLQATDYNARIAYYGEYRLDIDRPFTDNTTSRYANFRYTVDDSRSGSFPDLTDQAYLAEFDLYFAPGGQAYSRLRNGRTFTNGYDRGLDAAPKPQP